MKKKNIWIALFLIVILASVLRLWQLGSVPSSPDWDEVALGYDAYSIIHTGRDEFGKFLPVVLRSFDDYKPALYAYLAIPTVFLFGLDVFAVRLPSAISGIIMVVVVFYLVQELFQDYKYRDYLSIVTSFIFAISPWSIQFSRVAFESNVGVLLNALVVLFFFKGLKKPWMLSLSAFFAGLCIYVYQSEKVFTPLLALILICVYYKKIFAMSKKYLVTAFIIGVLVVLPMVLYIFNDSEALLRIKGTSIFTYQTVLLSDNISKLEKDKATGDILGLVVDNRRFVYLKTIVSGYLSHFDPNWLFVKGDIARHHAPDMGLLYLFELPLVLLGIYMLLFGDFDRKTKIFIFLWFLAVPIPASVTLEVPHAVRTLNFLPIYQILSAIGIITAALYYRKSLDLRFKTYDLRKYFLVLGLVSFVLFSVFNITYYFNQYFVQLNYYDSSEWQYGYEQAVSSVVSIQNHYQKVVVSDNQPLDKSYMFFLFYLKYSPVEYQKIGESSSGGFRAHHSFANYEFRPIDWKKDAFVRHVLYVGSPSEIPNGIWVIKTIYNIDGTPAIRIATT